MAKELPYFQFEPSEWQNGDIQMASNEAKIAFIEILCSYWQRLGSLPYAFALQRHCNGKENALLELINCNAIKEINGKIVISFLDSQLKQLEGKSQKARESANKRWNKDKNANAMRTHTKRNANRREENRIEDSNKLEQLRIEFQNKYPKGTNPISLLSALQQLPKDEQTKAIRYIPKYVKKTEPKFIMKPENYLNSYVWNDKESIDPVKRLNRITLDESGELTSK